MAPLEEPQIVPKEIKQHQEMTVEVDLLRIFSLYTLQEKTRELPKSIEERHRCFQYHSQRRQ